ncbi:Kinesin-like protein 7 [Operophtera brumata]|uniref:Kinesin-like protein 7 n=1 Tax=Operophtera brumata TaxID=104452 RepID=A0A0L7KNQ3_OPEBR|nr:Kinesin-like protein 7 [Operophtera brumata]
MSDNIKVVVKVRPLIAREIEEKQKYQWRITNNTLYQLDSNGRDYGQGFTFDKVYCQNTKTADVYNDVARPIVEAAVAGFNGTIFAYGQTSSGKTYTMTGTDEAPGIIPLAVLNLFEIIKNEPGRDFVVR